MTNYIPNEDELQVMGKLKAADRLTDRYGVNPKNTTPAQYPQTINYKFNEGNYLAELTDYINKTYGQHYSRDKFQAVEFIYDGGHGTGFNIGNVLKYAQRYGKKGTHDDARKDLMKVLHYALLQLHIHDNNDPNS